MLKNPPEVGDRLHLPSGRTARVVAIAMSRFVCRYESPDGVDLGAGVWNEACFTADFLQRWATPAKAQPYRASSLRFGGVM